MVFERDRGSLLRILAQSVSTMSLNKDAYYFHFRLQILGFTFITNIIPSTPYMPKADIKGEKNPNVQPCDSET